MMLFCVGFVQAQDMPMESLETLKSMHEEKEAAVAALQAEADAIQAKIDKYPGWKFGGFGSIGLDGLRNNNWFALGTPNSQQITVNAAVGGTARLDQDKYFWHNSLGVNLARLDGYTDKDNPGTRSIGLTNNALDFTSLAGYKIRPKWALSAELKWLSTVLERTLVPTSVLGEEYSLGFNKPGSATFSAGVTWLPIDNLTVNFHPLGYQKNWPGDLTSMAGCKIGAAYLAEIIPGVQWKSDLACFIPYTGNDSQAFAYADGTTVNADYGAIDLANWTWINAFTADLYRGIGLRLEVGLGQNRQQANMKRMASAAFQGLAIPNDDPFQSYMAVGLGYTFK